jgi:hypothetical protein
VADLLILSDQGLFQQMNGYIGTGNNLNTRTRTFPESGWVSYVELHQFMFSDISLVVVISVHAILRRACNMPVVILVVKFRVEMQMPFPYV